VAVAQFIPLVLFPWDLSIKSVAVLVPLALLCAFLGWALIKRRPWGRTLTIFVQGLNVIVRIITLFANVYVPEEGLNAPLLVTYVVSTALSVVFLSYIDKPEIQLAFES
jgi:hypothetical protein